ncbi:MAG: FAD-dependent oxidoreductase [Desulfobacterales bacterium]|jgi:ferredoxin-NADP reductase
MTAPVQNRLDGTEYPSRLLARRELAPGTVEIDLSRPKGFSFLAGQRIRLCHGDLQRDYSLASGPDTPVLTLCVRLVRKGVFSMLLGSAEPGTAFTLFGPNGYFVFHGSANPAVWVATGSGIAPFVSMCRSGIGGATILHGVRTIRERYYADLLRENAARYVACLSGSETGEGDVFPGRVTGFLRQRLPAGPYDFYLCGRREMIAETIGIIDERFEGSRIYTEIFY